jgi:tetratricopeptide (TPR) repeat protein
MDDLEEAIVLGREALSLCPLGHPDRWRSLNSLVNILSTQYKQLRAMEGLNEAIALVREALSLCPQGHPGRSESLGNLADCLSTRYDQLRAIRDLNEAISLDREALSLCPQGHPDRSISAKCPFTVTDFHDFSHFSGLLHPFRSTTTCPSQLKSLKSNAVRQHMMSKKQ